MQTDVRTVERGNIDLHEKMTALLSLIFLSSLIFIGRHIIAETDQQNPHRILR